MALLLILALPLLILLRALVLSQLWSWFVVTTFGAPELGIAAAYGIALVVAFLTYQPDHLKDEYKDGDAISRALSTFLNPFVFLGFGWVTSLFM